MSNTKHKSYEINQEEEKNTVVVFYNLTAEKKESIYVKYN